MSDTDDDVRRFEWFPVKGVNPTPVQFVLGLLGVVFLFAVPDLTSISAPGVPVLETALSNFQLSTTHDGLTWGMAALGLALLLHKTELVSFGHAAFFGGGAYGGAMLVEFLGFDEGLLILFGATLFATILALIIGWLVAEYLDIYFALLTLAFGQVLFAVAQGTPALGQDEGLFLRQGGEAAGDPPTLGFILDFSLATQSEYRIWLYYITAVLLLISLLVMYRIMNSPFGQALDAIGQDRTRARFIGIPVKRYVWASFTISGFYGGVAGGLYGLRNFQAAPEATLEVFRSGEILFMAILGGFQTLLGPIIGGVVLTLLLDNARFITPHHDLLIGLVLIFVVFFMPKGIVGSAPDIKAGAVTRIKNPSVLAEDVTTISNLVARKLRDAAETTRILLFGVK